MQFKIWHLIVFTALTSVAVSMYVNSIPDPFPYATFDDVKSTSSRGSRLLELVGDRDGPFRRRGASDVGYDCSTFKSAVRYSIDGVEKKYLIPAKYDTEYVIATFYENPDGDSLVSIQALSLD